MRLEHQGITVRDLPRLQLKAVGSIRARRDTQYASYKHAAAVCRTARRGPHVVLLQAPGSYTASATRTHAHDFTHPDLALLQDDNM
jgi:hypothetical protein